VAGLALPATAGSAPWTATMSRLAELQRVLALDPSGLRLAGVVAAPLDELADAVPRLLADDGLLGIGRPGGLAATEAEALRARIPELVEACRSLARSPLPASLEHGDLTPDQVIVGEMGPVFLDWSDGSITHPFLSAASVLVDLRAHGYGTTVDEDELVAAYLGPWLASDATLTSSAARDALETARTVLPLHMAALYADRILPGLEQPWEVAGMVPDLLRAILPG
jgi:hypothetical protein